MNTKVEFIYDLECPNVSATREELLKAFSQAKIQAKWQEWDRNSNDSPEYARKYGSPTILINGKDLGGSKENDANCCRVYSIDGKLHGVPPADLIVKGLHNNNDNIPKKSDWKSSLAAIPTLGIAILPKLTCAACWPAYAGIMSSMGIGFFNYTEYLFPITITALLVSIFALGFRAEKRQGYNPLYLGIAASLATGFGKFYFESNPVTYLGILLLIFSNIWNIWPIKNKEQCSACV